MLFNPLTDAFQPKWPVHVDRVDHCFVRIILDSICGIDTPWTNKIKSPAYKNMSRDQLEASIALGKAILSGEADLAELNQKSLELRGKAKAGGNGILGNTDRALKRKRDEDSIRDSKRNAMPGKHEEALFQVIEDSAACSPAKAPRMTEVSSPTTLSKSPSQIEESPTSSPPTRAALLKKITSSSRTAFQKRVLVLLLDIPLGMYTTYGAMAKYLSSSPRAVGNALRNNPFAPEVACHRVLASDGGLGGFKGSWGRKGQEGLNDDEKKRLLRKEGVKFDGRGRVVGSVWSGWKDTREIAGLI
jgi:O-6-methylguanine DNA methyltransferase